jgi:hypothetical protein
MVGKEAWFASEMAMNARSSVCWFMMRPECSFVKRVVSLPHCFPPELDIRPKALRYGKGIPKQNPLGKASHSALSLDRK